MSNADIFLFADDAKIFSHIKTDQDIKQLQCELVNFKNWMDTWLLKLNVNKCKSVSYGRCIEWLQVTGPKGHWSEGSLVRRVTGPNFRRLWCMNTLPRSSPYRGAAKQTLLSL